VLSAAELEEPYIEEYGAMSVILHHGFSNSSISSRSGLRNAILVDSVSPVLWDDSG
jgi:hypothetical protein